MQNEIFSVLEKTGIAKRPTTSLADNYSRLFVITSDGKIVKITVSGGDASLIPAGTTALDGEFTFDLEKREADAGEPEITEILRWINIQHEAGMGALLTP